MLNENIKKLRKQKGYSQEVFAGELNVVRQTVSKWEKGYSVPDAVMLEKIAELLEVSVSDLLGASTEKNDNNSELQRVSEQLSILNNQIAKELARKRRNRKITAVILCILLIIGFGASMFAFRSTTVEIQDADAGYCKLDNELENALHQSIMNENKNIDWQGECLTEAHFVLGTEEKGDTVDVFLIENISSFGFENGYFIDISGHSVPAVYTFKHTESGIEFVNKQYAQDGELYPSSIKKMFPKKLAKKTINGLTEAECRQMRISQEKVARNYLESIGRDEEICSYSDIIIEFLTDYGVSDEIENKLCDIVSGYNTAIGNYEIIENGTRYVYQTEYDEQNNRITFTKFEYYTNKIAEFIAVDPKTGNIVENAPAPEKVKYYKAECVNTLKNQYTTVAYYQ